MCSSLRRARSGQDGADRFRRDARVRHARGAGLGRVDCRQQALLRKCRVQGRRETVSGSGFTPGDPVDIQSSDGSVAATANAGASGAFAVTTGAPTPFLPRPESKTFTLTASDFTATGTTITATTRVTVTDLSVTTAPSRAALTEKVTWYFSGFDPGKQIYGHYLRRNEVARAEFGTAQGPCGLLKVNARFYPGGHPRYKTYTLQVDNSKPYSMHTTPRVLAQLGTMFF